MKFLLALLFLPVFAIAQSTLTDTIYFDENWQRILPKDSASFFRLPVKKTDAIHYLIKDYYANGGRQMSCHSLDTNGDIRDGLCTSFYKNGQKENYTYYVNDEEDGECASYYEDGSVFITGKYKKGFYDGEIARYYRNGKVARKERYNNGKMLSGFCFTKEGKDTSYFFERSVARFPGGDKFYKGYVKKRLHYPNYCWRNKIKGRVFVFTYFDEKGKIYKTEIDKSIHPLLDEEALRIINNMPTWEPALDDNGKPVKSERSLDILFE
jgi:hypothetical protein